MTRSPDPSRRAVLTGRPTLALRGAYAGTGRIPNPFPGMNTMLPLRATVANMKRIAREYPRPGDVFAYSPTTDERCSANPSDYFAMFDERCLKDSQGVCMILAIETRKVIGITSNVLIPVATK